MLRAAGERHSWSIPGTLRLARNSPKSLNPLLATNVDENFIAPLCFDLLIGVDERGRPVPRLAAEIPSLKNGGISRDGLTITYHLRRGVRWHDGAPFTSRDVKFSWAAIMNPKNAVISRRGYDLVRRVDTPNDWTVVFRLTKPFAPAILTLFSESDQPYRIIPEHVLARESDFNRAAFNDHPIGTGPFKFVRWSRGDRIEYEANPDYYLGAPRLSRVIIREIPDQNTMAIQLRTHAIDFMTAGSSAYRDLRHLPEVKTELVDINAYIALLLNLSHGALKEVAVRRAIATAIDKRSLVEKVTYGTGTPATGDLPPFLWAHSGGVRRYPYDPAAARRLLDAAGWTLGADGIRAKNGRRLTLLLVEPAGSETARSIDVQLQAMLHDVGIGVEIKSVVPQLITAPASDGGIMRSGKFDLTNWGWVSGADPDDASEFVCDQVPPRGENFANYCNPDVDKAERVATSSYDQAVRKRAYETVQQRLADDVPMVFLYWPKQRLAYNPDLHGVRSNGVTETWNVYEWSI
jgi:peptide/nickel transport system substrate-binding protein